MLINILFIAIWFSSRNNKNVKRGWRTTWKVIGIINAILLAWNVAMLLLVFTQVA